MPSALRTCPQGHRYRKTTDCPSCPTCEASRKPPAGLPSQLSAPARRALEGQGIRTTAQLARFTEADLLTLHGFGPASLPILRAALREAGLNFKR